MYSPDTFIQTSPAIVAIPGNDEDKPVGSIGVYEYLSKSFAYVSADCFYWFDYFHDGKTWAQVVRDHNSLKESEIEKEIEQLLEFEFLAVADGESFLRHQDYREHWEWDKTSGLFHFTVLNNAFGTQDDAVNAQLEKKKERTPPKQSWLHQNEGIELPNPFERDNQELFRLLSSRRTNRTSVGHRITKEELGSFLYAGLGITGYVDTPVGELPLSMTPSGGARNPYEAFVIISRGHDLLPGIYHYSATEHSLKAVSSLPIDNPSTLFADQTWMDDMSAIIVLVAVLERTMWKYPDPNAYRVVLIEAGHIAQNIMLAATQQGFSACPTAAMSHTEISKLFELNSITQVPVYAMTLDKPRSYQDRVRSNPALVSVKTSGVGRKLH